MEEKEKKEEEEKKKRMKKEKEEKKKKEKKKKEKRRKKMKKKIFKYLFPTSHNECGLHYRDQSLNVVATWDSTGSSFFPA